MEKYSTHIKAKTGWFDIDFNELFKYRDLMLMFVKRNYTTRYKQTVLGPLWMIINPMVTVAMYALVFGNIAGMSTEGAPQFVFYLASNAIWSYFATCIMENAGTFTANAGIMGKVYFPRLVMPISSVLTGMINLGIQLGILVIVMIGYVISGVKFQVGVELLLVPILIVQISMLGLGCGIIVASLTTRYRDLMVLASFGVQLWMYASPVVYTASQFSESKFFNLYMLNPMASIITTWRYAILGIGEIPYFYWGISWIATVVVLVIGVILFSRIEKTFMDTV